MSVASTGGPLWPAFEPIGDDEAAPAGTSAGEDRTTTGVDAARAGRRGAGAGGATADLAARFGAATLDRTDRRPFDPAAMPAVAPGSRGEAVKTLQEALNIWRMRLGRPAIAADGDFGAGTRAAVVEFQRAAGIGADGAVGPTTWSVLAGAATMPPPGARLPEIFAARAKGPTSAETARLEAAWSAMPGRVSVTGMAANGGRPVAVYVPPGFDASKPARVVTFFHGHGWDIGPALATKGDRSVLSRIDEITRADPQTIVVVPQAGRVPFGYWMKPPESFKRLHEQALGEAARLAGARSITVAERTVAAHSGAGLTLKNAVESGEFMADRIELLDSAYGAWAQAVTRWAQAYGPAHRPTIEAWYTSHLTQPQNNGQIRRMAPDIVTIHNVGNVDLHNSVPGRYLASSPR